MFKVDLSSLGTYVCDNIENTSLDLFGLPN